MTNATQLPNKPANRPELAETAPLVLCTDCGAEPRNRDRYCRRCGVRLPECAEARMAEPADSAPLYATSSLAVAPHRASGALLASIASGVSASLRACPIHPAMRRVMIALVSIPIWLLIVLLSPLDAYATARGIAKQF